MQPFKENDVFIIGPNLPHLFKSDPVYFEKNSKKSVHSLNIFFDPNGFFKPIIDLPEALLIRNFLKSSENGLKASEATSNKIIAQMLELKKQKLGNRLAGLIHLLQSFAEITDWQKLYTTAPADNIYTETEGLRMSDVLQFTLKNFRDNITLNQVASIACLTTQAFCRYFKKHTRKTYVEFLNEIRINEACKLILSEKYTSLAMVADECGFNSSVSFNRMFKKITGKSPLQYQKEYKNQIRV